MCERLIGEIVKSPEYISDINLKEIKIISKHCTDFNEKDSIGRTVLTSIIKYIKIYEWVKFLNIISNNELLKLDFLKNVIFLKINSEEIYIFNYLVHEFKPIFYHFLDGFINNDSGYTSEHTFLFLLNNNIISNFFNLYICDSDDIIPITKLVELKNNSFNILNLINKQTSKGVLYEYYENTSFNKKSLEKIFNYSIYTIGKDTHQTSIVNFIKNNKFNILSINSGFGIYNHLQNNKKFLPYYGISIDLEDNDKFYDENIFKVMENILLFGDLYTTLLNINFVTQEYNNKNYKKKINIYLDWLAEINKFLTDLFKINENFKDIQLNATFTNSDDKNIKLEDLESLLNMIDIQSRKWRMSLLSGDDHTYFKASWNWDFSQITFYNMLIELLDLLDWDEFDISIYNPQNYNFTYENFKDKDVNISNIIIDKNILHYNYETNKLYINPQESGSCTWYSTYWSLIFYFIFILESPDLYINFIKYINKIFHSTLPIIFSDKSFANEYLFGNAEILMKNVCNKFIDNKMLDRSILLSQRDFIFNINWELKLDKLVGKPTIGYDKILIGLEKNIKDEIKDNDENNINLLLSLLKNMTDSEETKILIYLLYKYNRESKLDYFNDIELPLDINDIDSKIQILVKAHESKIETPIPTFDKDLINNSLYQLHDTYKFEDLIKRSKIDIFPGYFNNYYYWVDYINHYLNELKDNNDIYMFILFAHRLNLINQIINNFKLFINSIFLNFEDPLNINGDIPETKRIAQLIYNQFILKLFDKKYKDSKIDYDKNIKLNFDNFDGVYRKNPYRPPKLTEPTLYNTISNSKYSEKFINTKQLKVLKQQININFRSYDDYKKLVIFLLNNPKYIELNFINNDISSAEGAVLFIMYNLHIIKNESNKLIYEKLLYFYCSLYQKKISINPDLINIPHIPHILCLLLLNKKFEYVNENGVFINKSSFNERILNEELNNILRGIKNKSFFEILKNSDFEKFDNELYLISKYNKYFKEYNIIDKITINCKGINFVKINPGKNKLLEYFRFNKELIFIGGNKILIIDFNNIIELHYIVIKPPNTIKINNIYINNNKILKYDEYKHLPFSYFVPSNCFNLIFNENNIYKIIYFLKEKNDRANDLLYHIKTNEGIYIFEINNNNLLFPQLDSDYNLYSSLCLDLGINDYNILYINYDRTKKILDDKTKMKDDGTHGYNFNKKVKDLFNFKKDFSEKLNVKNLSLNKISILKEDPDEPLIKYTKDDDKNEIIKKLKDKYTHNSIDKILFKINKCMINNSSIDKYKIKFNDILKGIKPELEKNCDMFLNNNLNNLLTCN